MFTLFRKRWGSLRTISIRAHWLWLTNAQLETIAPEPKPGPGEPVISATPYGVINDAEFAKLLAAPAVNGMKVSAYRAAVTCYNGQTVSALAGVQRSFVSGVNRTNSQGKEGREVKSESLETSLVEEGAGLQVTPLSTTSGKYTVLDVHTRVNSLVKQPLKAAPTVVEEVRADKPAAALSAESTDTKVDRQALQSYRLSTTLRVPSGRWMLVGGMTPSAPDGRPEDADLYLIVRVNVQELRDDVEAAQPDKARRESR